MNTHGTICWSELNTHDVEQAKAFYSESLGWRFEEMPMSQGSYWLAKTGETTAAGVFALAGPDFANVPDHWMTYISVDNVDQRVETAVAHGAVVIRAPWDVPMAGRVAILREPGGAVVGWMTPSSDTQG